MGTDDEEASHKLAGFSKIVILNGSSDQSTLFLALQHVMN